MNNKKEVNIEELRRGGVIKLKEKDQYSIWVKTLCCNLSAEQLRKVADISDKYGRGLILFSTRQIPIIPFINIRDVEDVKKELSQVYLSLDRCGPRVRNINVCYDKRICSDAVTNCISLGERLERYFHDPVLHKIKIGIAGCRKDCIICRILNDISFIGCKKEGVEGYDVYVGGRLGLNPFVSVKMSSCLTEDKCVRFVQNYFDFIKQEGKPGERAADLINRLGAEAVRQKLNNDLERDMPEELIKCETFPEEKEDDGKIILKIRAVCGEVTTDKARQIAEISEKYGRGIIHFAVRGDPEIPYIKETQISEIRKELEKTGLRLLEKGIDNIQTCFGDYCTNTACDTQSLLRKIERKAGELGINNTDIKVSGAGCPNSCGIAHLNDIGFLGIVEPEVIAEKCNGCTICVKSCKKRNAITMEDKLALIDKEECRYCGECIRACPLDAIVEKRKGFAVLVGGSEGEYTRLGSTIAEFLTEDRALEIAVNCLKLLKEKDTRAYALIDEVGIDKFKELIL